jgi:hypothetical protein
MLLENFQERSLANTFIMLAFISQYLFIVVLGCGKSNGPWRSKVKWNLCQYTENVHLFHNFMCIKGKGNGGSLWSDIHLRDLPPKDTPCAQPTLHLPPGYLNLLNHITIHLDSPRGILQPPAPLLCTYIDYISNLFVRWQHCSPTFWIQLSAHTGAWTHNLKMVMHWYQYRYPVLCVGGERVAQNQR